MRIHYGCPDGPHGDALPSALERSRPPRTLRTRPLFGLPPFLWNSLARSARSRAPAAGSGRRRTSCNRDRDPAGPHGTRPVQLHAPASSAFATAPVRPLLPPPPPRPPRMRGSSEPPFPGRHPTACCGELPPRRRVRRTGLEGPGKPLPASLLPSPGSPMFTDRSNASVRPAADRDGFGLRLPSVSVALEPGPLPDSPDHALRRQDFPDRPRGRSRCWSDERDEHADLTRGPRSATEGNGCRNGRRHAGHDHEKRGGEVERAQEPQLAVRDQIPGLHAGFDVVGDAGAGGRPNFAFAEVAACSPVDRLMRYPYAPTADSSPPPDLPFAAFSIRWRSIARASSSEGALAWIRAASFRWTPCWRNNRRRGSDVTPAYHPYPTEQPPFCSTYFSNSATRPACASADIPLPVMG